MRVTIVSADSRSTSSHRSASPRKCVSVARIADRTVSVPTRRSGARPRVTTLSAPTLFGTSSKIVGAAGSRSASKWRI